MSKIEIVEYTLPADWASYLINGDGSGMEQIDTDVCDRWMAYNKLEAPLGVSDTSDFCTYHDAYPDVLGCDCAVYTFDAKVLKRELQ